LPAFDIDAALRWARLDPGKTLARRTDEQLPFLSDIAEAGQELLLDTCVYIDGMQGWSPDIVADLLDVRQVNHSTIAIQELMHTVGVLDPRHSGTKIAVGKTKETIAAMPGHRIFTPDTDVLGRGAMLSGILCRIQGYRQDARLRALHDCVLFLQAQKLGLTVLTANSNDFDYLLQLMPSSRVLLYRVNA
jgi:hypothetical protein